MSYIREEKDQANCRLKKRLIQKAGAVYKMAYERDKIKLGTVYSSILDSVLENHSVEDISRLLKGELKINFQEI